MKKKLFFNISWFTSLAVFCVSFFLADSAGAKGVKTSYKRYSIFKYQNEYILCEPYTVKKDDWLYKIFRKKGEISEKDFPHFLLIFKELNPQISNIDAIEPGIPILIPLKKVDKKDYDLSSSDNIDVPVIEFSTLPDDKILAPFIRKHTVKKGENLSGLINDQFLERGRRLSEEGLKAFQLANPHIQNVNIIFEGSDIYLPDPSIKSQPWFRSFFPQKDEKENRSARPPSLESQVNEMQLLQLKKYSSLVGATLLSRGKMYFPGNEGDRQVLDLSDTPIIKTKDGGKILVLSGINQNEVLLKQVREFWKDLRIQMMAETLEQLKAAEKTESAIKPGVSIKNKQLVKNLLDLTPYEYIPDASIPFTLNSIRLEASFGRIIREDQADLLVNFGNVYGNALDILSKKEFDIISITPQLTSQEISQLVFSNLGYATWNDPSFHTGMQLESIKGVYAVKKNEKLFIPENPLTASAIAYLKKEEVKILPLPLPKKMKE